MADPLRESHLITQQLAPPYLSEMFGEGGGYRGRRCKNRPTTEWGGSPISSARAAAPLSK